MRDAKRPDVNFSVVIPLFNKAPHVRRAIESALEQTLAPHEVIVVDDGSTDDGLAIVRAMADPRIVVLTRSPPGPGGYAARNLAMQQATGDWVAFLDADDLWHPRHLADLAAARDAAAGDVGCLFSGFTIKEEGRDRLYPIDERFIRSGHAITLATFIRGWLATQRCPMWTGAIAIRRDVLRETGDFPAGRAKRGGDKDLWLRCVAHTNAAFAPAATAEFHQDTVNRVTKSTAHAQLPILVETIRDLMPKASAEERKLLRRLLNQEVALYARHAAGAGATVGAEFLRVLFYPEGVRDAAKVIVYAMLAASGLRRPGRN